MEANGHNVPNLTDVTMGPLSRKVSEDGMLLNDISGVNQIFMDALFFLMKAVTGGNVWRGTNRCGRQPVYSLGRMRVGTFSEMVTLSDMAFLIWVFENFYQSVLSELENEKRALDKLEQMNVVAPKWTQLGHRKFGGWSDSGKLRWNEIMVDMKERWERLVPTGETCYKTEFIAAFEERWMATFGYGGRVVFSEEDVDGIVAENDMAVVIEQYEV